MPPFILSDRLKLKNRWVMAPLSLPFSANGSFSKEAVSFLLERIEPFGMVVIGAHAVSERAMCSETSWYIGDTLKTEEFQELLKECHQRDIKVILQLCDGSNKDEKNRVNEMTVKDIVKTIIEFIKSTVLAIEAGFDGIEIHGANSYLFHEFLSPRTNQREDEYGIDLMGRSKLLRQVIKALHLVRNSMKKDFIIGLRHIPEEAGQGFSLEDSIEMIQKQMIPTDLLDYLHLSLRNWSQESLSEKNILKSYRDILPRDVALITSGMIYDQETGLEALQIADLVSVGTGVMKATVPFLEVTKQYRSFDTLSANLERLKLFPKDSMPLIFGPMNTESSYATGALSAEEINFYLTRTEYCDGIVVGAVGISPDAHTLDNGSFLYNEVQKYSYQNLNRKIHQKNKISVVQLCHTGLTDSHDVLSLNNWEDIIFQYRNSIQLALEAGFDGIELSFSAPSIWLDVLEGVDEEEKAIDFIVDAVSSFRGLLSGQNEKALGVRFAPESLVKNEKLFKNVKRVLNILEETIDYVSLNVSNVNHINSMISIERLLKGIEHLPVLVSGQLRTERDLINEYYKGRIPMKVRPLIFENKETSTQKDKVFQKLPSGLKHSVNQARDWYEQ